MDRGSTPYLIRRVHPRRADSVISEWLGYRKQDPRYDRLVKEIALSRLFSMTAVTGGLFIFSTFLPPTRSSRPQFINQFYMVFAVMYPALFITKTILMYAYLYTWDVWKSKGRRRSYRPRRALESCLSAHLVCHQRPHVVYEHTAQGRGSLAAQILAAATTFRARSPTKVGSP